MKTKGTTVLILLCIFFLGSATEVFSQSPKYGPQKNGLPLAGQIFPGRLRTPGDDGPNGYLMLSASSEEFTADFFVTYTDVQLYIRDADMNYLVVDVFSAPAGTQHNIDISTWPAGTYEIFMSANEGMNIYASFEKL